MRGKIHRSSRTSSPVHRRVFRPALSWLEARVLLSGNPTYYTVNLTSDTGASSGSDAYPTAGTPSGDLLWAINQANANTNAAGSVINFDPTVFATPQTITLSSTLELSESAGPEVIQGPGANLLTISGHNAVRVFLVDDGTNATLTDLTVSGGADPYFGGGISKHGTLAVTACTIEDNSTAGDAGGIGSPGALIVTACTLKNNSCRGGDGGGIYAQGTQLTVTDSSIEQNVAGVGGGVFTAADSTTISNSTIDYNSTPSSVGAGIAQSVGTMAIRDSTIASNQAGDVGGGLFVVNGGTAAIIQNTTIVNNSELYGGAIYTDGGALLKMANCTVAGNQANANPGGDAAGIRLDAPAMIVNCTIANNTGGAGILVDNSDSNLLVNTIVAGNTFGGVPDDILGGFSQDSSHNLIGDAASAGALVNGTNGNIVGVTDLSWLASLADNGGPTQTIALLPGSPAIDAGSNALAVDPTTGLPLTYDQRGPGFLRVLGASVDIGAYEVPAPLSASNLQTALTNSVQGGTGGSVTVQATSNTAVSNDVQAVNGLTNPQPSIPETVTLDLGSGSYTTDTHVMTQPGITLVIQNGTLVGGSPALVVDSGNVVLNKIDAQNATNAPTIVINGGSLTVRGSTIQESTGSTQAAIRVNGGTADLGTTASPGGNSFNVNGTGTLIQNTSGISVPAVGDTFENNGVAAPSILVLNPTANGALTLSGNASIKMPGAVVVESSSKTAISAAPNTQLSAWATGVSVPDPLAGLAGPSTTGLTNYGSVSFTTGSHTINPGIYSQIKVSGNASLTMSAGSGGTPGIYIIEGGGFTVTGNASVSGQNVFIYNTSSNYPNSGGNFGGITLSGNGTFALTAPSTGPYAGVAIFQSRANTRALSFSGNAVSGISGIIYAPNALLSFSGNSQLQSALDVGMLNLSGDVALTQTAAGSDGSGDTSGIANTLLAGDLSVYINDPSGYFTSDELARIQDAINNWDALLAPYNVTITEVTDPNSANIVLDNGTTSACGGMAVGVLGCYNEPNSEITLIQGWNWYAGADPAQIGASQYEFETTVLHELGHALGLGGATNSSSPMYETLAAGVAERTVTTQDLNIADPPSGADPQMAAGFNLGSAANAGIQNGAAAFNPRAAGLAPLLPAGVAPSSYSAGISSVQPAWTLDQMTIIAPNGAGPSLVLQGTDGEAERRLVSSVAQVSTDCLTPLPLDQTHNPSEPSDPPPLTNGRNGGVTAQPCDDALTDSGQRVRLEGIGRDREAVLDRIELRSGPVSDSDLDELAAELLWARRWQAEQTDAGPGLTVTSFGFDSESAMVRMTSSHSQFDSVRQSDSLASRVAAVLLAAGVGGYGAMAFAGRNLRGGGLHPTGRRLWRGGRSTGGWRLRPVHPQRCETGTGSG
jgi:hypothetical protein